MKNIFKFLLIALFYSYYFVAAALNFPWINAQLRPLSLLKMQKIIHIKKNIYLGTYPERNMLEKMKYQYGLKQVIVLLDPNFPISRELVKAEKKLCLHYDIDLIIIPISYFSTNIMDYIIIKNILDESRMVTYLHTYMFDQRMHIVEKILK